jgi:hypothetical protein
MSTLYPLLVWHARLDTVRFNWFVPGDFVGVSAFAARLVPIFELVYWLAGGAFVARQLWLLVGFRLLHLGKLTVVVTTALSWYVGIVATNSDFDFTVTNVIIHGAPYCALLWTYVREQRVHAPESLGAVIASGGVAAFLGTLLVFAFVEELLWDRLVWHDRAWLFGSGTLSLGEVGLALVVPLLALPQAAHYLLDGMIWRRSETGRLPAQRAALGFRPVRADLRAPRV